MRALRLKKPLHVQHVARWWNVICNEEGPGFDFVERELIIVFSKQAGETFQTAPLSLAKADPHADLCNTLTEGLAI